MGTTSASPLRFTVGVVTPNGAALKLRGRDHERATLDALITCVQAGTSQVLVLRGEPGIGKTALLDYLVAGVLPTCRVERTTGVESEVELPFSGLHQLCAPMLRPSRSAAGPSARCAGDGVRHACRTTT